LKHESTRVDANDSEVAVKTDMGSGRPPCLPVENRQGTTGRDGCRHTKNRRPGRLPPLV